MEFLPYDENEILKDGDIRMVPMTILLNRITDCVDILAQENENLFELLIFDKCTDFSFWELLDIIPEQGFRIPIAINTGYDNSDDDDWILGNGHHRFGVSILLVLDAIPVVFTWDMVPESSGYNDVIDCSHINYHNVIAWQKMLTQ